MLLNVEWHRGRTAALALVLCAVPFFAGCGSGENRRPVSGTVTVEGNPLESGILTLYPQGSGSTVGCEIVDGKYSLTADNGPTPGKYRVEIMAFRPTGRTEFDVDLQENVSIDEQYLPEKYNTDSTLEVEVDATAENSFDFDLQLGS